MDTYQYHINYDRLNDCISEKLTTYYKYQFVERQFIYIEFLGVCLLQKYTITINSLIYHQSNLHFIKTYPTS